MLLPTLISQQYMYHIQLNVLDYEHLRLHKNQLHKCLLQRAGSLLRLYTIC